ncbi:hypothetical protein J6590_046523 [Homalodisca vitripennis]|nr:hypothetical protein J6590_046523 [Homalodisca vitripennis]
MDATICYQRRSCSREVTSATVVVLSDQKWRNGSHIGYCGSTERPEVEECQLISPPRVDGRHHLLPEKVLLQRSYIGYCGSTERPEVEECQLISPPRVDGRHHLLPESYIGYCGSTERPEVEECQLISLPRGITSVEVSLLVYGQLMDANICYQRSSCSREVTSATVVVLRDQKWRNVSLSHCPVVSHPLKCHSLEGLAPEVIGYCGSTERPEVEECQLISPPRGITSVEVSLLVYGQLMDATICYQRSYIGYCGSTERPEVEECQLISLPRVDGRQHLLPEKVLLQRSYIGYCGSTERPEVEECQLISLPRVDGRHHLLPEKVLLPRSYIGYCGSTERPEVEECQLISLPRGITSVEVSLLVYGQLMDATICCQRSYIGYCGSAERPETEKPTTVESVSFYASIALPIKVAIVRQISKYHLKPIVGNKVNLSFTLLAHPSENRETIWLNLRFNFLLGGASEI